jgi:hypothetical protein
MGDAKTSKRNDRVFRPPRNRAIKSLNDSYVLAGLTSQALLVMQKRVTEHDDEDEIEFEAPSANGETTTVTRDPSQLSKLLHLASARGVYRFHASSFIGRSLPNKSSKDMAFPHPQSRKEQNRKKDIPNSGGVVWSVRR